MSLPLSGQKALVSQMADVLQAAAVVPGRVAVQQRVLPEYRAPFFEQLSGHCPEGISLFAGKPLRREQISPAQSLEGLQLVPARNLHFLDPAARFFLCWQSGLIPWLEDWDPAVLVLEANPRYLSNRQAVSWMHTRGRPVLGWGLGAPPVSGLLGALRRVERNTFLSRFDGLIAYSQRGAAEYQQAGFPEARIFVAPNAAAQRPEKPMPQRAYPLERTPQVLFVGRLQARKRLDLLFAACAALPKGIQPQLVVVGDGPVRSELEYTAAGIYPRVIFTGALHGSALEAQFLAADLFVLPGTGGLAVQQALSYALPVIAAQGDGSQEDMVRPENGWVVPPDDLSALTAALREALLDLPRLREMGRASFRIAREEINLQVMAASFAGALEKLLEIGPRQPPTE